MAGRPPSVWLVGTIAAFCLFLLFLEALVSIDVNFLMPVVAAALLAIPAVITRTAAPRDRGADLARPGSPAAHGGHRLPPPAVRAQPVEDDAVAIQSAKGRPAG